MNTIYWLSVFGAIVGIGVFILSILGTLYLHKYGSIVQRSVVEHTGILPWLRWKWLIAGIVSLIIALTI